MRPEALTWDALGVPGNPEAGEQSALGEMGVHLFSLANTLTQWKCTVHSTFAASPAALFLQLLDTEGNSFEEIWTFQVPALNLPVEYLGVFGMLS